MGSSTNRPVLLTGATGFVGRQILRELRSRGVPVTAIVRPGSLPRLEEAPGLRVLGTEDLFSESVQWWADACRGIDTLVHAAWYAEPGQYLQSPKNMDCLIGTLNLARGAAQAGLRRFVGIGTCFEYELSGRVLSVDTPLKPVTPYAGAKAAAYMALSEYLRTCSVEFAWCRLFYLHGDGEDNRRLVPYIRSRLKAGEPAELTSGKQIRDFMDVGDAGREIAEVALGGMQGAVNVCSGVPVTVRQLAERIADEYGRRDLLRFGVRADNLVDPPCVLGVRH